MRLNWQLSSLYSDNVRLILAEKSLSVVMDDDKKTHKKPHSEKKYSNDGHL